MDVSIIIPVYNAEQYIKKCINSLLDQKTKYSFEIICVDDGSTDNSKLVLSEYINQVILISTPNKGPGHARNLAVEKSKGKYLMFVDADDYVSNDFVEMHMEAICVTESDICISDYYRVNNGNIRYINKGESGIYVQGNYEKVLLMEFHSVNKAIKKEIFVKYPENIFFEDMVSMSKSILNAKKIVKINQASYFYNQVDDSTTNTFSKKMYDIFAATKMIEPIFLEHGYKKEIEFLYINGILVDLCIKIVKSKGKNAKKELLYYLKIVATKYPNWQKNKYLKNCRFMKRLYLFFLRKKMFSIIWFVFGGQKI